MHAAARARRARAPAFIDPPGCARHRPETTRLYQRVERYWPEFRSISGHLLARAGDRRAAGHTGAVTLIQRFGSALNLNVHFHMIFVDGVYVTEGAGAPVFRSVRSPGAVELQSLVQQMAERIGWLLEKRGLIERDAEHGWLSGEPVQAGSLDELIGHCITWRIAVGPRAAGSVSGVRHRSGAARPSKAAAEIRRRCCGRGAGRVALKARGAVDHGCGEGRRALSGRVDRLIQGP